MPREPSGWKPDLHFQTHSKAGGRRGFGWTKVGVGSKVGGMKPRMGNQKTAAMTLAEVLVVVFVLAVLALLLLPRFDGGPHHAPRINCVNNLKQIGLAYQLWAGDHADKYPMAISTTNGGTMELATAGSLVSTFQIMSNELNTPKLLLCPADTDRSVASNFQTHLSGRNISYFVGLAADTNSPQAFLSGDGNFEIGGATVKSGLLEFSMNTPIAWTTARHHRAGNIGFADGSVQELSNSDLTNCLQQTGLATNRLAIP